MGIQSFYKQRRPRQFDHKPIYWDPKKEQLEKRIQRIREEMIERGEIHENDSFLEELKKREYEKNITMDAEKRIRGSFLAGTSNLKTQKDKGITSSDRFQSIIRYILIMLVIGFIYWYFFMR